MKYLFFIQSTQLGLYRDLYREKNVSFYSTYEKLNPDPLEKICSLAAKSIDKVLKTPFTELLGYTHAGIDENTCVIMESGFLHRISEEYLQKLLDSKAKLCLLLIDSMKADSYDLSMAKDRIFKINWTQVYTYDRYDAEEYGWTYFGLNYYSAPKLKKSRVCRDAYFVGGLKGNRDSDITELCEYLIHNGVKARFDLLCSDREQFESRAEGEGLCYYSDWQLYSDVLKKTAASNCIIEILQKKQDTQSLRYFEAIALNKKLLTNNRHISELPFYDPRYIRYFEKPEDVDIEWLRTEEEIDYHYNNEFSPKSLFEIIKADMT